MKKSLLILTMSFLSATMYADVVQDAIKQAQTSVAQTQTVVANAVEQTASVTQKSAAKAFTKVSDALPDSMQVTFSKVYNDVKTGMTALAQSLKVGVEHIYGILVKQQVVYAITYLLIVAMLFLGAVFGYKQTTMLYKSHRDAGELEVGKDQLKNWDMDDSAKGVTSIFACILTGCCAIAAIITLCVNMQDIVMGLINPEYGAIKDILSIVNK